MTEPTEITVKLSDKGAEGPGWYIWETECPDEEYVSFR